MRFTSTAKPALTAEPLEPRQLMSADAIIEILNPSTGAYVDNVGSGTPISVTAGRAVNVRVDPTQIPNFNPMTDTIRWSFDDTSGRYNTTPGFNSGHVYAGTGQRTISVTISQPGSGTPVTDTISVSVAADSSSVTQISLASSGTDVTSTINAALASNKKILFERGGTYNISAAINIASKNNLTFGAYGNASSPLPVLKQTAASTDIFKQSNSTTNLTVENIRFDSAFDSVQSSSRPNVLDAYVASGTSDALIGKNILIRNCEFDNVKSVYENQTTSADSGLVFLDNTTVDEGSIRQYFIYSTGINDIVSLGNYVHNSIGESGIRLPGVDRALVYDNELYNPTVSWTGYTEPGGKSSLRLMDGTYQWAANNYLSGPQQWMGPLMGTSGDDTTAQQQSSSRYFVFENNYVTDGHLRLFHGLKDAVIRNNIFDTDSSAIYVEQGATDSTYPFSGSPYDGTYRAVYNVAITHNTRIARGSGAGAFLDVSAPGSGTWDGHLRVDELTFANNLQVGSGAQAVRLQLGTQSIFKKLADNVWPAGMSATPFRIADVPKSLTDWNNGISGTANDDVAISGANSTSYVNATTFRPTNSDANVGGVLNEARFDYYGNARSGTSVTAGAANDTVAPQTGSISGVYFGDDNGNGVQDGAETGQGGKTMYLDLNLNNALDTGEPTSVTDSQGAYLFDDLAAGTYRVRRSGLPSGYRISTQPNGYATVSVAAGQDVTGIDFGTTTTSAITGYYFGDSDEDGVFDSTESGQAGKIMYIDANNNGSLDTGELSATTDANGLYKFLGLATGTYVIRRSGLPSGYYLTTPPSGYASISVNAQLVENVNFGTHEI